jgi:hypothetical protein
MGSIEQRQYKFEYVKGFFAQGEKDTPDKDYDYVRWTQSFSPCDAKSMCPQIKHNFGLLDRGYDTDDPSDKASTRWERFERYVDALIESSDANTKYKVIYVGRHGEGYRERVFLSILVLY